MEFKKAMEKDDLWDAAKNRLIAVVSDGGNMGCRVFKRGKEMQIAFQPKINILRGDQTVDIAQFSKKLGIILEKKNKIVISIENLLLKKII